MKYKQLKLSWCLAAQTGGRSLKQDLCGHFLDFKQAESQDNARVKSHYEAETPLKPPLICSAMNSSVWTSASQLCLSFFPFCAFLKQTMKNTFNVL